MTAGTEQLRDLACAALRGDGPAWPFGADAGAAHRWLAYCGYHGIGPLVAEAMADTSVWSSWHGARYAKDWRASTAR